MKSPVTIAAGLTVVVAAGVFAFSGAAGGGDPDAASDATPEPQITAPASPREDEPAAAIAADPAATTDGDVTMSLAVPAEIQPGSSAPFAVQWSTPDGGGVTGELELQQIQGNAWTSVQGVTTDGGVGTVEVDVAASGIYRLAYGGSTEFEAAASPEVVVTAGQQLASRITVTAAPGEDGLVDVATAWTTEGGVPISGDLSVEMLSGDAWAPVAAITTNGEGTGEASVESTEQTGRFRIVYAGGERFGPAASDEALVMGEDVRTIPVSSCSTDHEIDNLPRGEGCHFTPVDSATFVVAHDYLDNAWWNALPMGNVVELKGEQAGLYEVVDRVIAPGRGAALGSASNWACGDECDVILQTCQGKNTGFTWLRRMEDVPPAA